MSAAADAVLAAIATVTGLGQADISRGASFDFDLACDDLDIIEIVMAVEAGLGIEIDEHFMPATVETLIERAETALAPTAGGDAHG